MVGWAHYIINNKIAQTIEQECMVLIVYVSESDFLSPNDNLSDTKNLVSFERELFENSSYKYRIK